ncbi:hypothetical protein [Yellowstone lake mimivirus]|uniref:hypothetical protein n=1 Tax=Yellowstone lake mimivirus TaxID=1586712 RepID=UPI0006EB819F|nr:hypothetical protein AR680_gp037 [Yellowstone lake mimivirus]BAT21961.1 hypothetical protein [Yellowstone lake mimivirus]
MEAYTRKHRNGNYSTRIDIPGLIKSRCWKNGKRVKCSRKPRINSIKKHREINLNLDVGIMANV